MTTAEFTTASEDQSRYDQYRTVSLPAVAGLVLGVLSLAALLTTWLLIVPGVGGALSWIGLRSVRRRPDELTGAVMARIGLALSLVSAIGSAAIGIYVYNTEVPEGYQRVTFKELQPDNEYPELPIPPSATQLDKQKVFVKGYVYPGDRRLRIKKFVLVPDMGTCCFGGQPKLTDMIEVTLKDPLTIDFSYSRRKLAGTLKVDSRIKPVNGLGGVYYQLEAEYVR